MSETTAGTRLAARICCAEASRPATDRYAASLLWLACLGVCVGVLAGCRKEVPEAFEPNLVHAMRHELGQDLSMEQTSDDVTWIVTKMFGTPSDPSLPKVVTEDEELSGIVSMENLVKASGPDHDLSRGLYQRHCANCHGVTGSGRGDTSAALSPYPRDYRAGIFKFKTTPRGAKPTKEDLARVIRHGIAGTAMNEYANLAQPQVLELIRDLVREEAGPAVVIRPEDVRYRVSDGRTEIELVTEEIDENVRAAVEKRAEEWIAESVDALVDYVIYLSWRGQLERMLIDLAVYEFGVGDGEVRLINTEFGERVDDELIAQIESEIESWEEAGEDPDAETEDMKALPLYLDSWEFAEDIALEIGEEWLYADEEVVAVPEPPADLPVAEDYEHYLELSQGDQADALARSVERGHELFVGKLANCSSCHGKEGKGDGQTTDYDDWTKEWTTQIGIKPENRDALIPLLARGALPPVNAQPRNFSLGAFHGGSSSKDLYRRITQGVDGSPMPAATFVPEKFERDDVWHLINFIRSLRTPPETDDASEPPPAA